MDNMEVFLDRMNSHKLSGIGSNIIRSGSYSKPKPGNERGGDMWDVGVGLQNSMSRESLMDYQPIQQ